MPHRTLRRHGRWLIGTLLVCLPLVLVGWAASLVVAVEGAWASPVGEISESSAGLNPDSAPFGIAAGPDGNVWFADRGSPAAIGRVSTGGEVTEFAFPGRQPYSIAVGPDGDLWFTEPSYPVIARMSTGGQITGEFNLARGRVPYDIVAGPDGNMWFTDQGSKAIGRITPGGEATELPLPAGSLPYGIAAGPDGNLWFVDNGSGTKAVGRITPGGQITEFTEGLGASSLPWFIAAGPDGNLWFTEASTPAIGRITPDGQITLFTAGLSPGSAPLEIAAGPDGNLWFTETGSPAIGRITPDGQITEYTAGLNTNSRPAFIAAGPDGNVWFTDYDSDISAIGSIGTGAPAAAQAPPVVAGPAEENIKHVCEGDHWSKWAGAGPSLTAFGFDGYQWLRDGARLTTGRSYMPTRGDVDHQLSCRATVTYPLLGVTVSATSASVTIKRRTSSPSTVGPLRPSAPAPQQHQEHRVQLLICTTTTAPVKQKTEKAGATQQRCRAKAVTGSVTFTIGGASARATLSRSGVIYATGRARTARRRTQLLLTERRPLGPGRYTLALTSRRTGRQVTTRQRLIIR